jgi:GxxExxY protein
VKKQIQRKGAKTQRREGSNEIFETQSLTYLQLTGLKLGLLVNFGERLVKDGIRRVVNGL